MNALYSQHLKIPKPPPPSSLTTPQQLVTITNSLHTAAVKSALNKHNAAAHDYIIAELAINKVSVGRACQFVRSFATEAHDF